MKVIVQLFPAFAHPPALAGRVAGHEGVVGNVFGDHSACADEGVTPDGVAADDCAVGAKGCSFFYQCWSHLIHFADFRSWVDDVGKNHRWAAEDTIFEDDTFINADVVLDFAFVAYFGIGADDDVLADVAVFTDLGTGEDVGEVPDFRPGAGHTSGGVYGERKRRDFFVRHLLGLDPPDWNMLEK